MSDLRDKLAEEIEQLKTVRDELRVQANLGAKEIRDHWEQLERRWQQLEGKLELARRESTESLRDIGAAGRQLVREIAEGYRQLRSSLK